MSDKNENKEASFSEKVLAGIQTVTTIATLGSGLLSPTIEQSQAESDVSCSEVRSISPEEAYSIPSEVDQLASVQEKEQEENREQSEKFSQANNQVIASGSPKPNSFEDVDQEAKELAISTAISLTQAFDEDDVESESSNMENPNEASQTSTAIDLNEVFNEDYADLESSNMENSNEASQTSTAIDLNEVFNEDDVESESSESDNESESESHEDGETE